MIIPRRLELFYKEAVKEINDMRCVGKKIPNLRHNYAILCMLLRLSMPTELVKVKNTTKVMRKRVFDSFLQKPLGNYGGIHPVFWTCPI